jgi:hypothetical protein
MTKVANECLLPKTEAITNREKDYLEIGLPDCRPYASSLARTPCKDVILRHNC